MIVPVKRAADGRRVVGLPKGHLDGDETPEQAASREVAEETGVRAELIEELGEVRYRYERKGQRVEKVVRFYLFRYRSGDVADHDHEIEEARWVPLGRPRRSSPTTANARSWSARCRELRRIGRLPCRAGAQFLLLGVRRPAASGPQDGHDPARRQVPQVPQERVRPGDDRLPALAAGEDLPGGHRPGGGQARARPVPREIEHDNPEFRRVDEMVHFLEQIYGRKVVDGRHRHASSLLADHRAAGRGLRDRMHGLGGARN